jgi:hypothetical protein
VTRTQLIRILLRLVLANQLAVATLSAGSEKVALAITIFVLAGVYGAVLIRARRRPVGIYDRRGAPIDVSGVRQNLRPS